MKKILIIICTFLCLAGCKPVHQVVVEHVYETHITDSVVTRDSTVLIPIEHVVDVVNKLDTLNLETSLAKATAYLDTTNMLLKGEIHNKQGIQFQIIEVEKWHTKDSIVEKPTPYPEYIEVKNPVNSKLVWWCIIASLCLLVSLCWIFRKWIIKLFT